MTDARTPATGWRELIAKEDWWAIWIGLGLVAAAIVLFEFHSSLKWIAVAPQKWSTLADLGAQLGANAPRYLALFLLWSVLFGIATAALGIRTAHFLPAFLIL